jgi:predicted ATPase
VRSIRLRRDGIDDWTAYPFSVASIAALPTIDVRARVLFFVGENGSGKSTLLEALACACGFGPEGGSRNLRFSTRVAVGGDDAPGNDDASDGIGRLADALEIARRTRHRDGFFLRAESFHNVATRIDEMARDDRSAYRAYGGRSLHERSHGESFLTLFLERFGAGGLYLLDEPEAALSPARQLALMARMHDLLRASDATQFIIATHSPILLGFPDAQILSFDGDVVHEVSYHETDAYAITRRFLSDPSSMLRELFDEPRG